MSDVPIWLVIVGPLTAGLMMGGFLLAMAAWAQRKINALEMRLKEAREEIAEREKRDQRQVSLILSQWSREMGP